MLIGAGVMCARYMTLEITAPLAAIVFLGAGRGSPGFLMSDNPFSAASFGASPS